MINWHYTKTRTASTVLVLIKKANIQQEIITKKNNKKTWLGQKCERELCIYYMGTSAYLNS